MSKSLEQLEADCARWRVVSTTLMDLGQRAIDASRLCTEIEWPDEAAAFALMAAGIGRLIEETVLPKIEAHHAEHYAVACEVARLERKIGEAS